MLKKVKKGGVYLLIAGLPVAVTWGLFQSGESKLEELAVEYEWCASSEHCPDSNINEFVAVILDKSEYSSRTQLTWCLAADSLSETRIRRGGALKGLFQEGMYLACPTA